MRRTILATIVAVLTMLTLAGTALAVDLPSARHPDGGPPGGGELDVTGVTARERFIPLGVKLAGNAVVNGHVYSYNDVPIEGAWLHWGAPYEDTWESGDRQTDASGAYSFSGLPAASGNGCLYLDVDFPGGNWWYAERNDASWTDPGPTTFDWHTGAVHTYVTRGGPEGWDGWDTVLTELYGADAQSHLIAGSPLVGMVGDVEGNTYVPPGTYERGATYFWVNQGLEYSLPAAVTVTAGRSASQTVAVDQRDAQRIAITAPYGSSGKPGTKVTLKHWQFPPGWALDYYGWADSPPGTPFKDYADTTTSGASPFTKTLTIPTNAPAGYQYRLVFDNTSGVLSLAEVFQVCTLKASKTAIRKGGAIKLSGVIPTEGHWGETKGKSKLVTVYARTKTASAAPTAWDPAKQGWAKVGQAKANGLGAYTTGNLRPKRTTWYVVRYPGDEWYWGAYTSVLRVRVY